MRKSIKQRNEEQRERQRKLRAAATLEGKPSRDDIARVLLHWTITKSIYRGQEELLDRVQDEIVSVLVGQGFDEGKAYRVFDDLVERYTKQRWGFRRKIHLVGNELLDNEMVDRPALPVTLRDALRQR